MPFNVNLEYSSVCQLLHPTIFLLILTDLSPYFHLQTYPTQRKKYAFGEAAEKLCCVLRL